MLQLIVCLYYIAVPGVLQTKFHLDIQTVHKLNDSTRELIHVVVKDDGMVYKDTELMQDVQ